MINAIRRAALPALAAAVLAGGALAWGAAPAQAQQAATYEFGMNGNVAEQPYAQGYTGRVAAICESDPSQNASYSGTVGGVTKGLSERFRCSGPIRVEGHVEKGGVKTTCTPFQYRDASAQGLNWANWRSLKENGGQASCAMTASHQ